MPSPSKNAKNEFAEMLGAAITSSYPNASIKRDDILISISKPKRELGDYSSSIALRLAKEAKAAPTIIAEELAKKMQPTRLIASVKVVNGYINISLNEKEYSKDVVQSVVERKEFYGSSDIGKGKKVLVEYPSVNPNKPWHVGHLRNALLGDAISNIMAFCSNDVEREDYIDDLGLQVAESLWGFTNLGNKPDKKYDQWLGEQYVLVNRKMQEDKSLEEKMKALVQRMEESGSPDSKASRMLAEDCVKAQYETALNYGIYHDVMIWESDIVREKLLDKAMKIAQEKGVLQKQTEGKYAGCITIDLTNAKGIAKDFENPEEDTKVLIRSNGTATYVAKDIAFHMWKFGLIDDTFKYKIFMEMQGSKKELYSTSGEGIAALFGGAKTVVNIIGAQQRYAQLILRAAFELMGYKDAADNLVHLSYGEVSIEGASLSGREGAWIGEGRSYTADSLLNEVSAKALEIAKQSKKMTETSNLDSIVKSVAIGAIKFEYLRVAPEKKVVFSWEKALSFEGNSGPYCMYTYARALRILEKGGYSKDNISNDDYKNITRGKDYELVCMLGEAQETVEKACTEYRPDILADYVVGICSLFSSFYESMPVIKGGEAKDIRMSLTFCTTQVIKNMLLLLGIGTVERM